MNLIRATMPMSYRVESMPAEHVWLQIRVSFHNIVIDAKDTLDSKQGVYLMKRPHVLVALIIDASAISPQKWEFLTYCIQDEFEASFQGPSSRRVWIIVVMQNLTLLIMSSLSICSGVSVVSHMPEEELWLQGTICMMPICLTFP